MNGLELSRAYFEAYGRPLLEERFPDLAPLVCAGLFGSGSECLGFDDDVSRDHDFDPGFAILLPSEDVVDRRRAFELERAYDKLPREFQGVERPRLAPVGGLRRGVMRTADFFRDKTGSPDGVLTVRQWLEVPSHLLGEAVNGAVFHDGPGEVTRIRESLAHYPADIRRKKLAGHLLLAAQAAPYNVERCLRHGEPAAAQMALFAFVQHAMSAIFLLNDAYEPFYKWGFRALRRLPVLAIEAELFEYLITTGNDGQLAHDKLEVVEGIAEDLARELVRQGLSDVSSADLERHAYAVNDGIADGGIRTLHILVGA